MISLRTTFLAWGLALCTLVGPTFAGESSVTATHGAQVITLEQAYDRALATDQSIRIAYHEVRKANLLPWSALTRLGPQVNAGAGYQHRESSFTRPVTETTTVGGLGTSDFSTNSSSSFQTSHTRSGAGTADISLQQPLIDLTVFPAYRLGKLSKESAHLARQFTIRETLFGVASAYYEVLKQQRLVAVNRQTLELGGEQLELAKKRAEAGEVTRTDVLRAQVTVETARRTLVESENTLEFDRNSLRNILNLDPSANIQLVEPPDYPMAERSFDSVLGVAYAKREDLREQTIAIEQDVQRRNEIIASYGPRVVAQADSGISNNTGTSRSRSGDWTAGVSVQVPIFTGGQREIDLVTAKHQIEQTRLNRDKLAKTIESDVKNAWLTVRSLRETLRALNVQVAAAQQSYADLQIQYQAGTATSVDVLTALNDLNTSRKDLAVQTYDFQVALRNLDQVSGVFQEARVQNAKIR